MSRTTRRLTFAAFFAGLAILPIPLKGKIALGLLLGIFGTYAPLFWRLRRRHRRICCCRLFYAILETDKRRASEMIVEQRCEGQLREDVEGTGKSSKR